GGGDCCGVRGCRPAFYDESNWEEEKHLDTKFERVYDKECAIEKDIANDGEKTRNLIRDNYDKELERKLVEKDIIIQTQRNEAFTTASIAALGDKLGHKLAVIDEIVERIPQMPKLSACVTTPCNTEIVTGCGSPRRGRCDEDFAFAG
ncbi:MAG: hypothetical protein FWD71_22340, partial [Oscillospiraceae bacterium]|nr:hypothetical protein [Oscillospiraceae bacterium]